MKVYLIVLLLLTVFHVSYGEENNQRYSIQDVEVNTVDIHPILVVTNRVIEIDDTNNVLNLSHEIDTTSIKYLIVTDNGGSPNIQIFPDFESAFNKINHNNLVFHVHGFGQDFNATLRSGVSLQHNYPINLILFDVPTEQVKMNIFSEYNRTQEHFSQSINAFDSLLMDYSKISNELGIKEKPTLFLHSLGNYLLEEYINSDMYSYNETLKIFNNILINAPAVRTRNHSKWVEKIDKDINIYITLNKSDFTLKGAKFITLKRQLGNSELRKRDIASNAQYFSFQAIAKNGHNYFIAPEMLTVEAIRDFYSKILIGNPLTIDSYINNYMGIHLISMNK